MGNYVSQKVGDVKIVVDGDVIRFKKNGKVFAFPLEGNPNSLSIMSKDGMVYINNRVYDLDNIEEEHARWKDEYEPQKRYKKKTLLDKIIGFIS